MVQTERRGLSPVESAELWARLKAGSRSRPLGVRRVDPREPRDDLAWARR